jgi:hypothetical protein
MKQNNLIPDFLIDTFLKRIKDCIDLNLPYEHYTRNLVKLNGKLPEEIEILINEKMKTNKYLFDVDRKDFYLHNEPLLKERTKNRLIEIAECGMKEVGVAEFGYPGIMSGLYIERVWRFSDKDFKSYMDWAKTLINEKKGLR